MRRGATAALLSSALMGLITTACREPPTAPLDDRRPGALPESSGARFDVLDNPGTLLASTNQGELVEIDLSNGMVSLLGDAGVYESKDLGWTGLAFDPAGNLYATSRLVSETGNDCGSPCAHLYQIDPDDGSVIAEIGSTGVNQLSDIDFADSIFGIGHRSGCCASLLKLSTSTAQATFIPAAGDSALGTNPYFPSEPLWNGGFAVHPTTGDFWGIEGQGNSDEPTIFRIDRATGRAYDVMRLGLDGAETSYGFDGLVILDNGTFLASRGGFGVPPDSVLYKVVPEPDSVSGLAEITVVPLTYDTPLAGHINGFAVVPEVAGGTLSLSLSSSAPALHPAIRGLSVNNGTQPKVDGEAATLTVTLLNGGLPVTGTTVSFRAEVVETAGGHSHYAARHPLSDLPKVPSIPQADQALWDTPLAGHFRSGENRVASIDAVTNESGVATVDFVAGYLGGVIEIFASAGSGSAMVGDALTITIRVPDLIPLEEEVPNAYYVGGTGTSGHVQGANWYVRPEIVAALSAIATAFQTTIGGSTGYLQFNDASLPFGGAFSSEVVRLLPISGSSATIDNPFDSHVTHALGVDIDVSVCLATDSGVDESQDNRIRWDPEEGRCEVASSGTPVVGHALARGDAEEVLDTYGDAEVHNGNHFHIRFSIP